MRWRVVIPGVVSAAVLGVFFGLCSTAALAQEPQKPDEIKSGDPAGAPVEGTLKTNVDDMGYGTNRLVSSERFPDEKDSGRVDRRGEIDAMSDHAIVLPNAFTPKQFSTSLTSTNLFLNSISFSPTDDLQTTLTLAIPSTTTDFIANTAVKIGVKREFGYLISIQPFANYQAGPNDVDVKNFGVGAGVLADFYLSDNLVLSAGAHGFMNLVHAFDEVDVEACRSRQEFLLGDCVQSESVVEGLPPGGHWLALHGSMIFYIIDALSLRLEVMTGLSAGSFLGAEFLNGSDNFAQRTSSIRDPDVALGIPHDSLITGGIGTGYGFRNVAVQLSAYISRGTREDDIEKRWLIYPVFGVSAGF